MRQDDFLHIGNREVWGDEQPFGLGVRDRRQHLYVIGKSGTGKTTLLRNCVLQDINAGRGVAVLDPNGDMARTLIESIPRWRTNDVIYFNPADSDFPIGLNLLEHGPSEARHLVASELVSIVKSLWPEFFGPRLEYILYAAGAALSECQNVSLLGLTRMLVDDRYRSWVLKQVSDPVVRAFWFTEYARYDKRFLADAIAPVQNKIGQLLMAPHIRNIVAQVRSTINARSIMDNRQILIANLSKGLLGEDKARLLGAVLVSKFQLAALSRADIAESERQDFYLYCDEAHNFLTDSFLSILSEARKYRLCLTLAHQYLDQLSPKLQAAIFGNVGSIIAFRCGFADVERLSHEFGDIFGDNLVGLENYRVVCSLLQNGSPQSPFIGRPAFETALPRLARNVIVRSRQRYATPRPEIEDRIKRWSR
jgi:hypothetical protein